MSAGNQVPRALTIAGSDSSGGAGIEADLKTMTAMGVYGMVALTAVTAQNTVGVQGVVVLEAEFVSRQIRSAVCDIGVDAVKCGMLADESIVRAVSATLGDLGVRNLVVDPVMIAKSGDALLEPGAMSAVREELIPLATVVTPNLHEAAALLDLQPGSIQTVEQMKEAARCLHRLGPNWVVVKGGHLAGEAVDVGFDGAEFVELRSLRIDTPNTHGTGCTYSSAIACGLARGLDVRRALAEAKEFITWAIANSLPLGQGHGPTNHFYHLSGRDDEGAERGETV
jgi:hydroxymethylpyrimidine/phosphomethylpyrimidine kinase